MDRTRMAVAGLLVLLAGCAPSDGPPAETQEQLEARARGIHERVMTLDTHKDIPGNLAAAGGFDPGVRSNEQVDLVKMREGGLDAVFHIVYTGQGALTPVGYQRSLNQALNKFDGIRCMADVMYPDRIELALTADDAERIYAGGKLVAMIGVENGYPMGTDLALIEDFHRRGARYMGITHNGHNQLGDSNTPAEPVHGGLSELGRQAIREMNRVGIMVDISHAGKATMMQALEVSAAPVIASHSSVRALRDHPRNLDDEQLLALKENGGVMQTVAFASYVTDPNPPELQDSLAAIDAELGVPPATPGGGGRGGARAGGGGGGGGGRGARGGGAADEDVEPRPAYECGTPGATVESAEGQAGGGRGGRGGRGGGRGGQGADQQAMSPRDSALAAMDSTRRGDYDRRRAEARAALAADVSDFVDHIDYAVNLIGIDHVGISSDFDGGGGVEGWDDATETFNVTLELVRRGYTEEQIAKMWSGNLLRVWREVERVAREMRAAQPTGDGG